MLVELFDRDIEEIMECEQSAFAAELQASRETYLKRFALGHIVLGYRPNRLTGIISFSYGVFDQRDPSTIPNRFYDWSMQAVPATFDTVFIYNLGVVSGFRGIGVVRALIDGAVSRAFADGCCQIVGEGPIPSYAGNEQVRPIPHIRRSLDAFATGGPAPLEDLLFKDPHLALYRRLCPCSIIRVIPGFLPTDAASGGFRAMLFRDLRDRSANPSQCSDIENRSYASTGKAPKTKERRD